MKWEPDNFRLEKSSIWSFPNRGNWGTHDSKYPGNCSPYVFRNLILRYSKAGDWILDPFAGGGTSLIEAKLLNRNIIGTDINPKALEVCSEKINFKYGKGRVEIRNADAKNLEFIKN
jgi:sensor protein fixL